MFLPGPARTPIARLPWAVEWSVALWIAAVVCPADSSAGITESPSPPPPPPLWQKAIAYTRAHGAYVAAEVRTTTEVFDGKGRKLGAIDETAQLDPGGAKPAWKIATKTQTGDPGMTINIDFGLQSEPASALDGYDVWSRHAQGEFDGQAVEIWDGYEKAKPENRVRAYLDAAAAFPRKADFTVPFSTPLGKMLVTTTLTYAPTVGGVWLPARAAIVQEGRFLFVKRRVQIAKHYADWRAARP